MVEFGHRDQNFNLRLNRHQSIWGQLQRQPLTTILFKVFEGIFLKYNIHQRVFEMGVAALSAFIAYLLVSLHQTSSEESCRKIA